MAAHRYWRIKNRACSSSQTGIGQIEMAETPGGATECTGGTAIASGSYGGPYSPSSSFTGTPSNNWFTSGGTGYDGAWIGYDFGASNDKEIVEVRCGPGAEDISAMPRVFDIEYSDDNVTWTWAWTCYNTAWVASTKVTFTKPAQQASNRYWAILSANTQNGGGDLVVSEMGLHETPGGPNIVGSGTGFYFPADGGYPAGNAFDGNTATIIYAGTTGKGVLLGYDLGSGNDAEVVEFSITSSNTSGGNNTRCIATGYLLYSQDGLTWLRCGDMTGETWGNTETKEFEASITPPVTVYASQAMVFSITESFNEAQITLAGLMTVAIYPAEFVEAAQAGLLSVTFANTEVMVPQAGMFVVARGRIANPRARAWTFTLDGHDFYVLRLGDTTTLIYDVYSEQWIEWTSKDLPFWRPSSGMTWLGAAKLAEDYGSTVVVGDDTFGLLWFLNPEQPYDEHPDSAREPQQLPFERIVTGQVLAKGRQSLPCFAIFVDGDNYGLTGVDFTPEVRLEGSDDQGRTFDDYGAITVPADYNQPLAYEWLSLGQIQEPGRIFRVVDNGVFARIDSMDMNDDGE